MFNIQSYFFFLVITSLLFSAGCEKESQSINNPPNKPVLTSPDNELENLDFNIHFAWMRSYDPEGGDVMYELFISSDNSFGNIAPVIKDYCYHDTVLDHSTEYFWKIIVRDKEGNSSESETWSFSTSKGFTDTRDDKTYKTVLIGGVEWMAENLAFEVVGKEITDAGLWQANSAKDGWCKYDNRDSNAKEYGILYQWRCAAEDACPDGWHLPSDEEWKELEMTLGMSRTTVDEGGIRGFYNEGHKLKEKGTNHWASSLGTDEIGFSGFGAGLRQYDGNFSGMKESGHWWTSNYNMFRAIYYNNGFIERNNTASWSHEGMSVRCVKD